jgi:hypothetical protein
MKLERNWNETGKKPINPSQRDLNFLTRVLEQLPTGMGFWLGKH